MRTEKRTVFITKDQQAFLTEKEARKHEEELTKTRYFLVQHQPDLNEGRGYYKKSLLIVEASGQHSLFAEEYCNQKIGTTVQYVQGANHPNAAVAPWSLHAIDQNSIDSSWGTLGKVQKN